MADETMTPEGIGTRARRANGSTLAPVLCRRDLVVYGICFLSPLTPWATFGYVDALSGGLSVLALVLATGCIWLTGQAYGVLSQEVREAGSTYAYARAALGPVVAYFVGWMLLLDYLLMPALCLVLGSLAIGSFTPGMPTWAWVLVFSSFSLAATWFGILATDRVNKVSVFTQLACVALVAGCGLWAMAAGGLGLSLAPLWRPAIEWHGVFNALSLCMLSFIGFDAISTLSEELQPNQRHVVPGAIKTTLLIMGALALAQNWLFSDLARGLAIANPAQAVYEVAAARLPAGVGLAMGAYASLVVGLAIAPAALVAVSRVLYAMALDRQLPAALARIHPRHRVPHVSLLLAWGATVGVALLFAEHADLLVNIVSLGAMVAYVAVNVSVLALFARRPDARPWAHRIAPVLGVATTLAVITQMPTAALGAGLAWFVLGWAGRRLWQPRAAAAV